MSDIAVKVKTPKLITAYDALFPMVQVARRDGAALLSEAIVNARSSDEVDPSDPGSAGRIKARTSQFGRQVGLLKVILDALVRLPMPTGDAATEPNIVPSSPSPKLALLARYREPSEPGTPDRLDK